MGRPVPRVTLLCTACRGVRPSHRVRVRVWRSAHRGPLDWAPVSFADKSPAASGGRRTLEFLRSRRVGVLGASTRSSTRLRCSPDPRSIPELVWRSVHVYPYLRKWFIPYADGIHSFADDVLSVGGRGAGRPWSFGRARRIVRNAPAHVLGESGLAGHDVVAALAERHSCS